MGWSLDGLTLGDWTSTFGFTNRGTGRTGVGGAEDRNYKCNASVDQEEGGARERTGFVGGSGRAAEGSGVGVG